MSRDRLRPRISITKFAEYLDRPTPVRRNAILVDQRFPRAIKAAKFRAAFPVIVDALLRGGDLDLIDRQIAIWRKQAPTSGFKAECLTLCIDALAAFKKIVERGDLGAFSFAPGLREASFELGGVELSVRPEALVAGPEIGAVKVYLAKTTPLTKDGPGRLGSAGFAAAALHLWAERTFGTVEPRRCLVIDVFDGEVYDAPRRHATRRKHMVIACEEIAAVWPSLKPPSSASRPRAIAAGRP
jgi:hypothetical protein